MADPKQIRNVFETYAGCFCAGDPDGMTALYAEDAWVEDPIGSPKHEGKEAIGAFYRNVANGASTLELTGPVRVAGTGTEAAAPMKVSLPGEGGKNCLDIIDVMTFDESGKITSMRAYWRPDAMYFEKE